MILLIIYGSDKMTYTYHCLFYTRGKICNQIYLVPSIINNHYDFYKKYCLVNNLMDTNYMLRTRINNITYYTNSCQYYPGRKILIDYYGRYGYNLPFESRIIDLSGWHMCACCENSSCLRYKSGLYTYSKCISFNTSPIQDAISRNFADLSDPSHLPLIITGGLLIGNTNIPAKCVKKFTLPITHLAYGSTGCCRNTLGVCNLPICSMKDRDSSAAADYIMDRYSIYSYFNNADTYYSNNISVCYVGYASNKSIITCLYNECSCPTCFTNYYLVVGKLSCSSNTDISMINCGTYNYSNNAGLILIDVSKLI